MLNERTSMLLGEDALKTLEASTVAIFGLGGVGSYIAESLSRVGIGKLLLVDNDVIEESNINRQLYALHSNIGRPKVDIAKERILDINPSCTVVCYKLLYLRKTSDAIDLSGIDYIADAIDTVEGKLTLIKEAKRLSIPIISSMGTGNKKDPLKLEVADIYDTSVCPLARVMRKELRALGIGSLKVVYSKELPKKMAIGAPIASLPFVPNAAGLIMASTIVEDILKSPST